MMKDVKINMLVMKFGGSSLEDPDKFRQVGQIICDKSDNEEVIPVVSAMGNITDQLEKCANISLNCEKNQEKIIEEIRGKHKNVIDEILNKNSDKVKNKIDQKLEQLKDICQSINILGETTPQTKDWILSLGEQFTALILSEYLKNSGLKASVVNGSEIIITDKHFGSANPLLSKTREKIQNILPTKFQNGEIPVVTGFIAATEKGKPTTLGRGGSDYTATLVGSLMDADSVQIWTDVDGVKRADPDLVPESDTLPHLTFEEAAELSYFGARVIHPKAIDPLAKRGIPLVIKNTKNPNGPSTVIKNNREIEAGLKSVTSISDISLITVTGHGMIGIPGIAAEVFSAVAEAEVNVLMISQSSSEQNITFLVKKDSASRAINFLKRSLEEEINRSTIQNINTKEPVSIIAAVGNGLKDQTGIDSGIFNSLARRGVNLLSIAHSSDYNISVVVENQDERKAVKAIHDWIQSENSQPQFK